MKNICFDYVLNKLWFMRNRWKCYVFKDSDVGKANIYISNIHTFREKQKYDKKIDNILVFACIAEDSHQHYHPADIAVIRVQIYIRTDHMHLAAKASPWHRHPRVIQTQQISKNDTWFKSVTKQEINSVSFGPDRGSTTQSPGGLASRQLFPRHFCHASTAGIQSDNM